MATCIEATDDQEWQLLLALGRYGGICVPSEVVKLRWRDVDFARARILIHAVKTEHFDGHETRYIPIFDELRRPFLSAFNEGIEPADFVIRNSAYRQPKANLRQQFGRLVERAGVKLWDKPWQNTRATRKIELIERLTLKEACKIIGNGELVPLQHYQMLRPQYLETAIERDRAARKTGARSDAPRYGTALERAEGCWGIARTPRYN